jgi:hypothetical protein
MKPQSKSVAAKIAPPVVAPPVVAPPTTVTLARSTKARKGSSIVYQIPGLPSTVKIARSAFGAVVPDALTLVGSPFAAPAVPMAKLSKEERAAIRAKLTPADKARIARERATRAMARAATLEAAAAV